MKYSLTFARLSKMFGDGGGFGDLPSWSPPGLLLTHGKKPSNPTERTLLHAINQLGRPIANSTSILLAEEEINRVVPLPVFGKTLHKLRGFIDFEDVTMVTESQSGSIREDVGEFLGPKPATLFEQGLRYEISIMLAQLTLQNLHQTVPMHKPESMNRKIAEVTNSTAPLNRKIPVHIRMIYNTQLPIVFGRSILASLQGQAAVFGLFYFKRKKVKAPPRLSTFLAQKYRDGNYALLRLLASIKETHIPQIFVPSEDRYDLDDLLRKHRKKWEEIESSLLKH